MHHVVRHPAIEPGERLHTDRGLPVGTFPQVTPHVYVEPVGGGIGKTGVAQAASAGCLDIGANGRIYPFLAFQDLEKGADNDVAVIFDRPVLPLRTARSPVRPSFPGSERRSDRNSAENI